MKIVIGGKKVDYDTNFKLFMTTTKVNPHYLPDICMKVTLINFTITFEALTEQLLKNVIKIERNDIELQRDDIILSLSED